VFTNSVTICSSGLPGTYRRGVVAVVWYDPEENNRALLKELEAGDFGPIFEP
jgi:hypothetical protein